MHKFFSLSQYFDTHLAGTAKDVHDVDRELSTDNTGHLVDLGAAAGH